jgi:DNA-directed RNA polymerase subunit H (RpoH/RPB5)
MSITDKILKSRGVLKVILNDIGFDTESIKELSEKEINILFNLSSDDSDINNLGNGAAGCNFSVNHSEIKDFHLNIVYFNMPEKNSGGSKTTKSFADKIYKLYDLEKVDPFSSTIIIINEPISETLEKSLSELNISLQDSAEELSKEIIDEMKTKDFHFKKNHFRRCTMFDINTLLVNLKEHRLVPEHIPIRNEDDIQSILDTCNCTRQQLPIISRNDIMAKYTLAVPGDIMKINRTSKMTGNYPFYRLVR